MSTPPTKPPADALDAYDNAMFLRGVDGGVRKAMVDRIRKLVEQDPKKFAAAMRGWLNEGHRYDD